MPDLLVDQIAAGEVIERPAAAVKELVENALDAGATRVTVALDNGGINRIAVADDGIGMDRADLALAVQRHCTSKLASRDLRLVSTLGFRGEALPSIGSAARLAITSRRVGGDDTWRITVAGGIVTTAVAVAGPPGTAVVVEDLFFATPARRKFLKTPRAEADHAVAAVTRLAVAAPAIAFRVTIDGRTVLDLPPSDRAARIAAVLGVDAADLIGIAHDRGELGITGHALGPAITRPTASGQFVSVNDRPVIDPLIRTAIRVGFHGAVERGRHGVCALFLTVPFDAVDVNVHPAKTELRFREPDAVRALVIGAIGRALGAGAGTALPRPSLRLVGMKRGADGGRFAPAGFAERQVPMAIAPSARTVPDPAPDRGADPARGDDHPLGAPVAQVLDTYVVAVADDGTLVLVDQHAAHERLTLERLRAEHAAGGVRSQALLLPTVVELRPALLAALDAAAPALGAAGLLIEPFGPGAVLVRALPALLGTVDPASLVRDLADELADPLAAGIPSALADRTEALLARLACHGSVRAGRRLNRDEMASLLRQLERTPNALTCPHGRPTALRLTRGAIERMFGRA